ncbi:hypothetical protein CASFOL_002203 [Castilleja foliolosa]|uniref:Terpene synthase metal-binding domain-containing protein n=1 Tax=Castilleja foliolosa TaxID=1961234 RepID=A0ABD3EFI3_9LAMI
MAESVIQPQAQLISIKLTDGNYLLWKQQVWAAASGYGLEGFLTGEATQPSALISNSEGNQIPNPDLSRWKRQDQLLVSWLLSSLSESLLITTVGLTTAFEIWKSIENVFANQNKAKVMQIRLQLQTLKKGTLGMREYLNKIKSCCDLLSAAGERVTESDQVLYVLGGLGVEYNPVLVSITSRSPTQPITLNEVHAILLSLENRLETMENAAAGTDQDGGFSVNLSTGGKGGRGNFQQSNRGRGNSFNYNANNRGRGSFRGGNSRGRGADKCYQRLNMDFTPAGNMTQSGSTYQANFHQNKGSGNSQGGMDYGDDCIWYPDSGATNHLTHDFNNLNVANEYQGAEKIHMGNGADWVSGEPLIVRASAIICRLMNDLVGYEFESKLSAIHCYMKENGGSKMDAFAELEEQIKNAWKDINRECLCPTKVPMRVLMNVVNLARLIHLLYKEEDGYNNPITEAKDCVKLVLIEPVKM